MAKPTDVIIMIHGIRTYAIWTTAVRSCLEAEGFIVEPTNYMRLDALRFLLPSSYFRNQVIERVWLQIRDVIKQHPGKDISFIAHSFGTYVLAEILARNFDLKADRIIFCGSVLRYDFPFEQIADRFQPPILNEIGTRDAWPAIAESITYGYGSAGTFGFRRPRVRDRWHNGMTHSAFLTVDFCRKYWVPYFKDKTIVEADTAPEPPTWWISALNVLKLRYVGLAAVGLVALALGLGVLDFAARSCAPTLTRDSDRIEMKCGLRAAEAHLTVRQTITEVQRRLSTIFTEKDQKISPLLRSYEASYATDPDTRRQAWGRIKTEVSAKLNLIKATSDAIQNLSVDFMTQAGPEIEKLKSEQIDQTLRDINANVLTPRQQTLGSILNVDEPAPEQVRLWLDRLDAFARQLNQDLSKLKDQLKKADS